MRPDLQASGGGPSRWPFSALARRKRPLPRGSRRLVVTGLAVLLASLLGAALLVVHFHRRAIAEATQELQSLALVLAGHAEGNLQSVELLTRGVVGMVDAQAIDSIEQFNERLSTRATHDELLARVAALPQVEALFLTNANGVTVASTRAWPQPFFSIADRPHFSVLRDDPARQSYLAPPAPNVQTGTWNIYLSHRLSTRDGQFLGIAGAGLSVANLESFLGRVARGRGSAIAYWRRDGVLMARFPPVTALTGQAVRRDRLNFLPILAHGSSGTASGLSPVDGQERLIAVQALNDYPVVVTVTRSMREVLALWRRQALFTAGALLMVIAVTVSIVILGIKHLANRDLLEKAQVDMQLLEEHSRAEAEIHHLAHHDALTGLANRTLFQNRLRQAVMAARTGQSCAVLCLDLDHFKDVNDTLGHPVGDALLRAVTRRLQLETGGQSTIARLGGDEFAIVQTGAGEQPREAGLLAQRLVRALSAPFAIDEHHVVVGASIGIAVAPDDGDNADQLLKNADLALYRAKADGRSCFRFFEPEMHVQAQARRTMIIDLRRALEAEEFVLFYQPKVEMRTRRITGFEALLRWQHPRLGLVMPDRFIALAEETGLIRPIGAWALTQACRHAAAWPSAISVAVNLSPVQFAGGGLMPIVQAALESSGLEAKRLELEITETVLLRDATATFATLHGLRALGVGIALDDFGTGYSSLSYLQRFPFSRVKIDRSFIRNLGRQKESDAIVRSVIDLCRALGMATTAEGVETEAQYTILLAAGCDELQGHLFGRALPLAEILLPEAGEAQVRQAPQPSAEGPVPGTWPAPKIA
jgi:diguanylate cyclase (GGDEF)-like protein